MMTESLTTSSYVAPRYLYLGDSLFSDFKRLGNNRSAQSLMDERLLYELGNGRGSSVKLIRHGCKVDEIYDELSKLDQQTFTAIFALLGPNDSSERNESCVRGFASSLERLISCLSSSCKTVYYVIPPIAESGRRPYRTDMVDVSRAICRKYQAEVIDLANTAEDGLLDADGYHLNAYGHLVIARMLLSAMDKFDEGSHVCRLINSEISGLSSHHF